ncbi:MAG TPA: alpha/beta fold hydrolase [Gaiellaceae bacterium]|nr:alpha/beta fold hydrolase [Gaiellaceae bacterium]
MKRLFGVGAALLSLAGAPAGAAATRLAPCGDNGLQCATLSVPLDYSGAAAGQVPLYVEVLPAAGTPRGVMVMLAGGPGQASAQTFQLGVKAAYWRSFFPGYTLVAYDDRGTGKSGALGCPLARSVADCGGAVPGRAFYTTREHAEDIESVRLALGVDRIGLWGVSYGSKHAVAYALAYPSHVERLLLDSAVVPDANLVDPVSLRVAPASVSRICSNNSCPGIAPGIGDRLVRLANELEARPVSATLHLAPRLAPFPLVLDGDALLSIAFESDLSSAVSSQLPAAVDAALAGSMLPLERLVYLDTIENVTTEGDVNFVLFLSTNCGDGPFPWTPNDTPERRRAALDAAISALPADAAGAFGSWALQSLRPWPCVDWPAPSGGAALGPGPLPDVPVFVLAGDRDIRTPTANAVTIASRFRQGRVLVVPGAGHSVLNHSPCAANAVRTWLGGGLPPAVCTRFSLYVPPVGAWRKSVGTTPAAAGVAGLAGRTVAALVQTIHDAEDDWMLTRRSQETTTGLVGGRLTPDPSGVIRLQAYSSVSGLAVTGLVELRMDPYGDPVVPLTVQSGTLRVTGAGAARGTVTLTGNRLTGTLARRAVSARF